MFQEKKEKSKKICWLVLSGKCLQDKYQKYNFKIAKQSAQKLGSWCTTLEA